MADGPKSVMEGFLLVGVNRRQLPHDAAAKLFASEGYNRLCADLSERDVKESVLFLGEEHFIFIVVREPGRGLIAELFALMAERAGLDTAKLATIGYALEGEAALHHLFELAGGFYEASTAEPQLANRLRECQVFARSSNTSGPFLEKVLTPLIAVAQGAEQSPSAHAPMAALALEVAGSLHGDVASCRGLMVGLGEMALILGDEFLHAGLKNWTVVHPSQKRAADQARKMGGHYRTWEELEETLPSVEIIVCDRGSGQWCLSKAEIETALKKRKRRPILIIDMAVPGDVEDAVHELEDAFLFRLEDLERLAREDSDAHLVPSVQIRDLVEREFQRCLRAISIAPCDEDNILARLRQKFEEHRRGALAEGHTDADAATANFMERLLKAPEKALNNIAQEDLKKITDPGRLLTRLFDLEEESAESAEKSEGEGER